MPDDGAWTKRCFASKNGCPLPLDCYLMDQKKVTYEVDRRSKVKYYLSVFFELLDIGVNNAYICYMKLQAENSNIPALNLLEFRQAVARSLLAAFQVDNEA